MTYQDFLHDSVGGVHPARTGILAVRLPTSARDGKTNPDHHLWNNRGTWWCHFTLHHPDHTAERVRVSLKTRDLAVARRRRDELLGSLVR